MSFSHLGLSDKVLAAVAATGYTTPTPIQEQAIPHVLARRDVLGIAQTGTGKTAAFVLPMLTMLEKGRARARMPRTLILEPTRELAAQVKEQFDKYGVGQKLNVALLIGGVSFGDQDTKLTRGVDVLIATPGRLLDHIERGGLLLTGVELLVIDEADRMLDMGFIPDIERICKLVPFTRQTLFFTATMPPEIRRITETFLHNPERIEVSRPADHGHRPSRSSRSAVGREPHEKREVLRRLLRDAKDLQNAIIFCNRKREVAMLHKSLQKHGFGVGALHGDMDQSARTAALDQFRKGEIPLLVASDVAARGLDIPGGQPRLQFRRAASRRRLRPPHRPHRPRRPRRHRDLDRDAARSEIHRRDRKADRTKHPPRRRRWRPVSRSKARPRRPARETEQPAPVARARTARGKVHGEGSRERPRTAAQRGAQAAPRTRTPRPAATAVRSRRRLPPRSRRQPLRRPRARPRSVATAAAAKPAGSGRRACRSLASSGIPAAAGTRPGRSFEPRLKAGRLPFTGRSFSSLNLPAIILVHCCGIAGIAAALCWGRDL